MNELDTVVTVMPYRRRIRWGWTAAAFVEIVAAGCLLCILGSFFAAPRVMKIYGESRFDIARLEVQKFANEAYPQWVRASKPRTCPSSLAELFPYMDAKHARDPWGSAYSFDCAGGGIVVRSPGEDRRYDTADDIRSDR